MRNNKNKRWPFRRRERNSRKRMNMKKTIRRREGNEEI